MDIRNVHSSAVYYFGNNEKKGDLTIPGLLFETQLLNNMQASNVPLEYFQGIMPAKGVFLVFLVFHVYFALILCVYGCTCVAISSRDYH